MPTAEENLQFREAASGMRDWYVEQYGNEWLMKLDTAIAVCELQIDAAYESAVSD